MTDSRSKILIVDDIQENVQILAELLSEKYRTYFALGGAEALKLVEMIHPDLILLDVMMPDIDGYKVCRLLKENETLRQIPVIFLTSMDRPEEELKGLALGAADYIIKPFNPQLVLQRVGIHIELKLQRDLLKKRNQELEEALVQIKVLKGIIPICSSCKKIRDDAGYWQQVEDYISKHSDVLFSHGICDDCLKSLYPDQ